MFYIDNEMVKMGLNTSIITPEDFAIFLKSILIDGSEIAKPDVVNENFLTFNNGYKINPGLNIVEITDGVKSFNIKLDQIDLNTLKSDKDLSELNKKNIVLKNPKVSGWEYEENTTHYIFHNGGASFEINKKLSGIYLSVNCVRGLTNVSGTGQIKGNNLSFYIIYNNNGFSLLYEYTAAWFGHWGFYNNNEVTVFCEYSKNINWNSLKTSILFLNGINKNALQSEYINTSQLFNNGGGSFSFFPLTASGQNSDVFLNSSGNLKDSFNIGANLIDLQNNEKVIILKNRSFFMGISYDDSVY